MSAGAGGIAAHSGDREEGSGDHNRRAGSGQSGALALIAAVAVFQASWFCWVLREPLPNAANVGGNLRRLDLLWRAFPGVIPGVEWSESNLGAAADELMGVSQLTDRLPILAAASLIAAAAVSLGELVLLAAGVGAVAAVGLPSLGRVALAFALGNTGLSLFTLVAGRLGVLAPWPVRVFLGGVVVAGLVRAARSSTVFFRMRSGPPATGGGVKGRGFQVGTLVLGLVIGLFVMLMLLGSMQPSIEYDTLEYHLQGPKEFFEAGRIGFLRHNVYTSMPLGVEMLHLLGMEVMGDWWKGALVGQVMVMLHAPATAAVIAATLRMIGAPRAGLIGAAVYLTTPWVYRIAIIPFVEGPLCLYHAALVLLSVRLLRGTGGPGQERGDSHREVRGCWAVLGLLAGGAMACKYPALVTAVLPFGVVSLLGSVRDRTWRVLALYSVGVAIAVGPWLLRNVADTGNPVYPLAQRFFGGRPWSPEQDARWSAAHGPRPVSLESLESGFLETCGRSDWQSPLYAALVPLAFLRRGSKRIAAWLWVYVVWVFLTWYLLTHRLDRFWLPMLPALAVLAGLGADWSERRSWRVIRFLMIALAVMSNLVLVATPLSGPDRWTAPLADLRATALSNVNPPLGRLEEMMLQGGLPAGGRVLVVGQASIFHLRIPVVYNTVFNEEILEKMARGATPDLLRLQLRRAGITYVYVDWSEIERHRKPGGYGFSDRITPEWLSELRKQGVLGASRFLGPMQELYEVR